MRQKKRTRHFGLMLLFTAVLFLSLLANSVITSLVVALLVKRGVISVSSAVIPHFWMLILANVVVNIPISFLIAVVAVKFPLKPVRTLIDSMDALGSGKFDTRVNVGAIMRRYPAFVTVSESFNRMAEELENTELLRSDFVNNFSHEFKTPIVSIAGFARLLKRGNLTPQQQRGYINAIEEESLRLSCMATNVLNLSKVENQTILTDVSEFNLSEQLRACLLLLEPKWGDRELDLQLELGEHTIRASEELLKQVWINLLDNALKFTPEGHAICVTIDREGPNLAVRVRNTGSEIGPEHRKKIFNKFYQADESHATQGNGVGLAVVKRIVELHDGTVSVESGCQITEFTVRLPG